MSGAFWYSLLTLSIASGMLVAMAEIGDRLVRVAATRRLLWVGCLAGITTLVPLVALGIPFYLFDCLYDSFAERFQWNSQHVSRLGLGLTPSPTKPNMVFAEIASDPVEQNQGGDIRRGGLSERLLWKSDGRGMQENLNTDALRQLDSDWEVLPFVCVWLTGIAVGIGWVFLQHRSIVRLLRTAEPVVGDYLKSWIQQQARKFGLRRPPRLVSCGGIETPVAFGMIRPTIAVPKGFLAKPFSVRMQAIFVHELSHLASGDPFWNLLASFAKVLMWWHPILWVVHSRLKRACEEAADEATALLPNGPEELAIGLLECARDRIRTRIPALAVVPSWRSRSVLARRVSRLLALDRYHSHLERRRCAKKAQRAVVVATALAVFFASLGFPVTEVFFLKGDVAMRRQHSVWRHSLIAAALAAFASPWGMQALAEGGPPPDRPREGVREEQRDVPRDRPPVVREGGPREHAEAARPERERVRAEGEARREAPQDVDRAEGIERKLDQLRRALREAEESRQADRAEQLRAQIRELEANLRRAREIRPPEREAPPEARPPMLERLEGQMAELREKLREARESGSEELVRELEGRLHELEAAMRAVREGRRPPLPGRGEALPAAARERALERLERAMDEVRERLQRARQEGREGEVRELEAQLNRMERQMAAIREGRPPLPPPPRPLPPERVERARQAAELLRREGFGDMAELLMRSVTMPPEPARIVPPGPPPRHPDRPEGPPAERPDRPVER
ncbi:MAG: M56 family metallopeptidase [Thermogutta sp.]